MIKDFTPIELGDYFGFLKSGLSRLLSQQDIGLPVLISGNIKSGRFNFDSLKYWYLNDPQGANTNNYILEKGDILLCFINSLEQIGKLAIFNGYERPCIYTTNLFRIKAKPEFDSYFLYYLLSSQLVQSEIKAITKPAVNQASFTTVEFQKIKVPFINLGKQKKIAKILSTVDNVIEQTESAIAKYQAIKQGLMHDLFTRGIDVNTGKLRPTPQEAPELYKESALGLIPKDWEVKRLCEIGEVITGSTPSTKNNKYYDGNIMFISPADISKSKLIKTTVKSITELGLSVSRQIPKNAICVVCIGSTIGKIGLTTDLCTTNQQVNSIIPHESSITDFLFYASDLFLPKQLSIEAGLQAVPIVNKSSFEKLVIPSTKKHKEAIFIGNKLNSIDQKIQTEQQALAKYQQVKAGLLQDLLTGRVEVSVV
ncbi:MAG: restriction endonuclease subunit S [Bizionia sp.]|nr:restriction endonuclease subunit S [Bizionia sp.]